MKKIILLLLFVLPLSLSAQYNSWDGCVNGIAPNSHIRVLSFFVNIIYDVHSDTNCIQGNIQCVSFRNKNGVVVRKFVKL